MNEAGGTSHRRFMLVAGVVILLGPLTIDLYLPSLPAIQQDLQATEGQVQATMAFYLLGLALGQFLYGHTSDAFGRRPPLLVGLLVYLIGSLGCALSTDATMLCGFRLVQAIGGCAGGVILRAMVRDRFEVREMARTLATFTLIMAIAPIFAPVIGGLIHHQLGWRAVFLCLTAFGALAAVAAWRGLPETHHHAPGTLPLHTILPGCVRLLRHRHFMGFATAGAIAQAGVFAYISTAPFILTRVYGVPEHLLGWNFAATGVAYIAGAQLNRRLLQTLSVERLVRWSLCGYLAASSGLVVTLWAGWAPYPVFLGLVMGVCVAMGFLFPNTVAAALAPFREGAGSAAALLGFLQFTLAGALTLIMGLLPADTALPTAGAMCTCVVLAQSILRCSTRAPTANTQTRIKGA